MYIPEVSDLQYCWVVLQLVGVESALRFSSGLVGSFRAPCIVLSCAVNLVVFCRLGIGLVVTIVWEKPRMNWFLVLVWMLKKKATAASKFVPEVTFFVYIFLFTRRFVVLGDLVCTCTVMALYPCFACGQLLHTLSGTQRKARAAKLSG